MKKKTLLIYFSILFMTAFVFTSFAKESEALVWKKFCTYNIGTPTWCNNTGSGSDGLAKFTNTMGDYATAKSAYSFSFSQTKWTPKVTIGEPIYTTYVLYDNKASKYYRYDSNFGKKLNGIAYTTTGLGNTVVSYYPAPYEKPTTNLDIKSGDALDCASKPMYCNTYSHASEFSIN